ncbi:MAG: hypothetical protein H6Q66_2087 [Firmicutes bacterium]|nr:hypothetical protein [Bacillota bacterium]
MLKKSKRLVLVNNFGNIIVICDGQEILAHHKCADTNERQMGEPFYGKLRCCKNPCRNGEA